MSNWNKVKQDPRRETNTEYIARLEAAEKPPQRTRSLLQFIEDTDPTFISRNRSKEDSGRRKTLSGNGEGDDGKAAGLDDEQGSPKKGTSILARRDTKLREVSSGDDESKSSTPQTSTGNRNPLSSRNNSKINKDNDDPESRGTTTSETRAGTASPKPPSCWEKSVSIVSNLRGEVRGIQSFFINNSKQEEGAIWQLPLFLDTLARGFSQVYLISNPFSGFILFTGLLLSTTRFHGLWAALACICSNLTAYFIGASRKEIYDGQYGYDAVLCGAAYAMFVVEPTVWTWSFVPVCFLGFLSALVRYSFGKLLNRAARIPPFTAAFNLLFFFLLKAVRGHAGSGIALVAFTSATVSPADAPLSLEDPTVWLDAVLLSVGGLTFCNTYLGSAFILGGIFWSDVHRGVAAVVNGTIGNLCGLALAGAGAAAHGIGTTSVFYSEVLANFRRGYYGYNACGASLVPFRIKDKFEEEDEKVKQQQQYTAATTGAPEPQPHAVVARFVKKLCIGMLVAPATAFFTYGVSGWIESSTVLLIPSLLMSWILALMITKTEVDEVEEEDQVWRRGQQEATQPVP